MTSEELKTLTLEHLPQSEVKVSGEIPYQYLEKYRAHAIEHVQEGLNWDGFRPGHIPESVLISRIGEMPIIQDMAEHALEHAYPTIVRHFNLDVIGYPKITLTKIAKDNPLGFSLTVAVVPPVTLPDYRAIAKTVNKERPSAAVTDADVDAQIEDILRQKLAYERLQKKAAAEASAPADGTPVLPTPETVTAGETDSLPPLTDEYVKTLGQPGQFATVADFRAKIREHLTIQKAEEATSQHRAALTDAIIDKSTCELPAVLIEAEINQMLAQMEADLTRAQLNLTDYLSHIKKTKEELVAEWRPSAEKRARLQLVLNAIAKDAAVTLDPARVDSEVSALLERFKDADERRVRLYVESVLSNDAVMKLLEDEK
jgi:trigger factor